MHQDLHYGSQEDGYKPDEQGPWIEFGTGWAKVHYRRELTDQDRAALQAAISGPAASPWECKARKQGTPGGNAPADCDWPGCGCDPAANKVLEAIDEAGFEITPRRSFDSTTDVSTAGNDRHYLSAIRKRLEQIYDASAGNPRLREQLSDEVDWVDARLEAMPMLPPRYVKTLEGLVQCLIDNDPEDLATDGGIRVIDVWRKDAERALSTLSRPEKTSVQIAEEANPGWKDTHRNGIRIFLGPCCSGKV